jgi:hypothetical protein
VLAEVVQILTHLHRVSAQTMRKNIVILTYNTALGFFINTEFVTHLINR